MNPITKSPLVAFFLSFIPGMGHFYWGRPVRGLLYALACFGLAFAGIALGVLASDDDPLVLVLLAIPLWALNVLDMIVTLLKSSQAVHPGDGSGSEQRLAALGQQQTERFLTILLSFVPGLGHFQMGLMNRGLGFLLSFFGVLAMVVFLAVATHREVFLVFLAALPVIWLYGLFDAIHLLHRRQRGEEVADRTIFEEMAEHRDAGRKSKAVAAFLGVFPGAGHMYLGLQRRGLQLMAAFLLSIYILDVLRLSLFMFLLPLIWFYSFFDALQHASRYGRQELEDVPVVSVLMHRQKWLGIGLLGLGLFYLLKEVGLPIIQRMFPDVSVYAWFDHYFQTTIVSVLLIAGGIRLLMGSKRTRDGGDPQ